MRQHDDPIRWADVRVDQDERLTSQAAKPTPRRGPCGALASLRLRQRVVPDRDAEFGGQGLERDDEFGWFQRYARTLLCLSLVVAARARETDLSALCVWRDG